MSATQPSGLDNVAPRLQDHRANVNTFAMIHFAFHTMQGGKRRYQGQTEPGQKIKNINAVFIAVFVTEISTCGAH